MEIEKAVKSCFKINSEGFLYLQKSDVDFEKLSLTSNKKSEYEKLEKYCRENKWWYGNSYRKRQTIIKDILSASHPNIKEKSNFLYDATKIKMKSITSINSLLNALKAPQTNGERFYRGQANFKWKLQASIYRENNWLQNEKNMMDEMVQSNPEDFNFSNTFNILSKMQHYELPTRLIDITTNPLIALFFACHGEPEEDGQMFVFNPPKEKIKFDDSDTVSLLSNLSKMGSDFGEGHIKSKEDRFEKEAKRLVHFIRSEKSYFENYIEPGCLDDYVFVKARFNNRRIINQSGAFILVGCKDTKKEHVLINEAVDKQKTPIKFIIPFSSKRKVLMELKTIGINIGIIYPEIDRIAKYIKDKYN